MRLPWRLGWPVSLACVGSHFICRYDDGKVTHNIEATKNGAGGFHSHPDDYYLREHHLPQKAVTCGSDLRAVTPREMLGLFVGIRARFFENTRRLEEAETDYLLARYLFPRNRQLYVSHKLVSLQCGLDRFEPGEAGHGTWVAWLVQEMLQTSQQKTSIPIQPIKRKTNEDSIAAFLDHLDSSGAF
jgi:hypothetical protein